jgi:N-acetylglucosaminyldiphosphoundecaprenol N-acetyl-beta-D-mannosaminyltransferase
MTQANTNPPSFRLLGVQVHAMQIPDVVSWLEARILERAGCRFVAVTGMHGVMEAQHDRSFKEVLNSADLVVPDGMPLVWAGRHQGYAIKRRVAGPEFMATFCQHTGAKYRHFFYGGAEGVADRLADVFQKRFGIQVAGTYCPPFRPLALEEEAEVSRLVTGVAPDILWVGLSTPKQEKWMYEHRETLPVPVMVGVGAAFDFYTGRVRQAPAWMQERGLEWLFRLRQEPKRLWRRYLVYGSEFALLASLELLGLKKF